ncbi:vacuolar protein sorting-associated protein 9A-like [Dorcoceras hygrometricum]|uniref:Vacuolar protein sorting-associated protein 9A-like n=1 Tax=Dorcoceras hygrometricum TaxID=472368 RepID=A0A2Z7B4B2_9LAMI|nr:vacuolar protein sorting-associated protein 9A-like [Dorcoceras hygrometricum]
MIGGRLNPVVDLIGESTAAYSLKCRFPREIGRSQAPRRRQVGSGSAIAIPNSGIRAKARILQYIIAILYRTSIFKIENVANRPWRRRAWRSPSAARSRTMHSRWPRMADVNWPLDCATGCCDFVHGCATTGHLLAGRRPLDARTWLRDVRTPCTAVPHMLRRALLAVATGCATGWRIARHAPHTLRQACVRAPHATWWRRPPPCGRRPTYRSPSPILQEIDSFEENLQFDLGPVVSSNALEEQLYCVESPESPPPIPQRQESSSSSMRYYLSSIRLKDAFETLCTIKMTTHKLINSVCQDAHTISDVQKIHLNDVKKIVLAQGVTAGADSLEIKKAINAVDAKILSLDGQVAAIRSEHLEVQAKISADLLGLSTQIDNLVDYIRRGDAKKGEGSSSRRPLPTPVQQSEGTGDAVRLTEPTQADIDNANRAILERMRNEDSLRAERERDTARRERRLSRSGAYKRRRGF